MSDDSVSRKRRRPHGPPGAEQDDRATYLDFMASLTSGVGSDAPVPARSLEPLRTYISRSALLSNRRDATRSSPTRQEGASGESAFARDCERILAVPDADLEEILGERASSPELSTTCKLAVRSAAAGLNVALVSASPSVERVGVVRRLFEAVCHRGIPAVMLHGTVESLCCFPLSSERACAASSTVAFALGLGTSLDVLPPSAACRVLCERGAGHLFERLRPAGPGGAMLFLEDVFSVSRSALSRASLLVAHMMRRPTLPWGGLQVVASGCPISSAPPLQTRRDEDVFFLPMSVEWERWFPVALIVPPDPMLDGQLRRVLTSDVASTAEIRREFARARLVAPVAGPRYLSAPGVLTVVAFEGSAKRKAGEADGGARDSGAGVLVHRIEASLFLTRPPLKAVSNVAGGRGRRVGAPGTSEYAEAMKKLRVDRGAGPSTAATCEGENDAVAASVVDARDVALCAEVRAGLAHLGVRGPETMAYVGMMVLMLDPCALRGRVGRVDQIDPLKGEAHVYLNEGVIVVVGPQTRQVFLMGGRVRMDVCMWPFRPASYLSPRWAAHVDVAPTLPVHIDPFGFDRTQVSLLAFGAKFPRATYQSCPDADAAYVPQEDMATACTYFEIASREGSAGHDERASGPSFVDSHRVRSELWSRGFRM